jgi:hypothetical protein
LRYWQALSDVLLPCLLQLQLCKAQIFLPVNAEYNIPIAACADKVHVQAVSIVLAAQMNFVMALKVT